MISETAVNQRINELERELDLIPIGDELSNTEIAILIEENDGGVWGGNLYCPFTGAFMRKGDVIIWEDNESESGERYQSEADAQRAYELLEAIYVLWKEQQG